MADRRIYIRQNQRSAGRSFFRDHQGHWATYQDEHANLAYVVDWSDWLGSDTISAVTFTGDGLSVSGSNTTTTTTATVSSVKGGQTDDYGGTLDDFSTLKISITTTAGLKKDLTLRFYGREM